MYYFLPGTEEPVEADITISDPPIVFESGLNFFMAGTMARIDPFNFLHSTSLRFAMNRKLLREDGEELSDISDNPTEPLGAWQTIAFIGRMDFGSYRGISFWETSNRHPKSTLDSPCTRDEF